jgi:hypothetical protein
MTLPRPGFSGVKVIRNSLTQGVSPRKLALTVVLGLIVGILPTVWGSTIICAMIAFFLGLNQPCIQAANFLAYPLQIALFVPFHHLGARIFPWGPSLSIEALLKGFSLDFTGNISLILMATLKAVAAWLLTAPPAAVILYLLLVTVFTRIVRVQSSSGHPAMAPITKDAVRANG